MPMPVHVAPQATDAVEIRVAADIVQRAAFGTLDDERLVLAHLREGVPDVLAIPTLEIAAIVHHGRHHETVTGVPTLTPSMIAALSPTIAISKWPLEPTRAISVISGWSAYV